MVDRQRLADLEVVAMMQPVWMQRDPYYYQAYLPTLGEKRCATMMPLRSFFDRGIPVVSSTDFPIVDPPSPLDDIAIGALRWYPYACAPGDVWAPEERASVEQMIRSYTINGATANFLEDETGSIEVGKSADLVVLNENILELPPERVGYHWMGGGTARVVMTIFRGKTVYAAGDADWAPSTSLRARSEVGDRRVGRRSSEAAQIAQADPGLSATGSAKVSTRRNKRAAEPPWRARTRDQHGPARVPRHPLQGRAARPVPGPFAEACGTAH